MKQTTQQKANRFFRLLARRILRRFVIVTLEGAENLPPIGTPVILAANHQYWSDPVFIATTLFGRTTHFAARGSLWNNRLLGFFLNLVGMVRLPIGGANAEASLEDARKWHRTGDDIGIFPEGTRSRDGILHKGHTGVARIAHGIQGGARVAPIAIVWERGIRFGRPGLLTLTIAPSISVPEVKDPSHAQLRLTTDTIMESIAAVTLQPYDKTTYAERRAKK